MKVTGRKEKNLMSQAVGKNLEFWESGQSLTLTAFGKAQGAECLSRHQNLTQFLEMVCGVDEETAEVNACRLDLDRFL